MKPTRTFDLLERFKTLFPDKQDVFASKPNGKWIYHSSQDYYRISHDFAYGLIVLGFAPGDKIVTITNNRPEWNFVDLGMALAGVVHVPVYTSMNNDEYRYILEHSDAKMVIVSDEKFYSKIRPITDEVNNIRFLFTFDEVAEASCWTGVIQKGAGAGEEVRGKIE
ncbi:MAG: AMP-binding protein, partial [Bacteroidales bacterium]|nr:AMP-binding protein [Bacteroidales bacterium]